MLPYEFLVHFKEVVGNIRPRPQWPVEWFVEQIFLLQEKVVAYERFYLI